MAFLIFDGPFDYYSGQDFGLNYSSDISGTLETWTVGKAATQQYRTYQLNTTGIGALELIPDPSVTYSSYGSGVNGVATYLTFTPSGSISGPTIRVVEETGVFAYSYDFALAATQFVNDINAHASRGDNVVDVYVNFIKEINLLQSPGISAANAVANYFHANAASLAVQAGGVFADLARDAQNFERIANEWATPVYFLDTGSGYKQISSSTIDFGINLKTVNGAEATWAVNGTAGTVTVTGFTVVGHYSGDPNYPSTGSHGYYDFFPAEMNGWLDVTSYSVGHNQALPVSQWVSQVAPANGKIVGSYILWETGNGGAQLLVNGVSQPLKQNVTVTSLQLAQAQYKTGSGSDTLWVQFAYTDGSKSPWESIGITAPVDTGPTVHVANINASHGQVLSGSALFSGYSDPFGDAAVMYDFWNSGTSGGYFQIGSLPPFAPGQDVYVTAASLSGLQYHSGAGTDTLWVRANDGTVWGPWSPAFTVTSPINTGPVISVSNKTAAHGQSYAVSSLFTYSDPFGIAATQYDVWNSGTAAGAHFLLNGVALPSGKDNIITAAQLASLTYQSGSGVDTLWIRAHDDTLWGAWSKAFTIAAPVDTGPVISVSNKVAAHGQSYAVSSLFTYSDPFGIAATQYDVWNSGTATGAHFLLNGVALPSGQDNIITAAQLASLTYQSGSGVDTLWIRAHDDTVWGAWSQAFTVTSPIDTGPVISVSNKVAAHGQSYAVSSLFTYSDPFGVAATQYDVWNSGAPGAHFLLNGVALPSGQDNIITAAQLAFLTYQSGSGVDTLWIRAHDDTVWGAWSNAFTISAPVDSGPVLSVSNINAAHGQSYAVSSLFTYSDPFGSAATQYDVWDTGTGGGHFMYAGQPLAANGDNIFTAAQLPFLTYVSGSGSDTLWIRANDGTVWGNWSHAFTVTAPIDTGPVEIVTNLQATHGQVFLASSLFSYSDPFGSPATQYEFWDAGTGGGHFGWSNGGSIGGTNVDIIVNAQDLISNPDGLGHLIYTSGSGTDTLWVRANDGTVWGQWSHPFTVTAPIDPGPQITPVHSQISSLQNQVFSVSSLFTYSDPFGSPAVEYDVWDTGGGGGHFLLGGLPMQPNQDNFVAASALSQLLYQVGTGSDTLWIRAYDGTSWGPWSAPFVISDPAKIAAGQTLEIASETDAVIAFAGPNATLKLDNFNFKGTVSDMMPTDTLNLAGLDFASMKPLVFTGNNSGGTLTISDATHTMAIELAGNNFAYHFVAESDGRGGTNIVMATEAQHDLLAHTQGLLLV